ncbi:MAG: cytochrome P450 [Acidobacteriales bacterium]|nr:cytochrome P450 [Terriglobales bacterium]
MQSPASAMDEILISKEFLADPYPILRQLREENPIYWCESIGGWIVTRYDDMVTTFRDVTSYSNEGRLARVVEYLPSESRARFKAFEDHYRTKGLLHSDPPDHTRLRALVTKSMTASMVEAMRGRIQTIVDDLVNTGLDKGGMDVIADIAIALPFAVLARILGTPPEDQHLFKKWADDLLSFQGVNKPGEEILERAQKALVEIRAYLADLIIEKRRNPREDLMSLLVVAESEGNRLSQTELINTGITLLVAGHETTTSLIGNGIYLLLRHTDQWKLLREDPSLLNSAIEEILRYESPVARQPRLVKQDAELGGKQIHKGDMVFQMLNSANRDPAYFIDPDRFDIQRQKNRHIAFGVGIHFCVGAYLARTEAQVVFKTVLDRLSSIRLVEEKPTWDLTKPNSRMLKTLPVLF